MRLYNTLSRTVEDVQPINQPEVTVYTCGPTVYDYPHIGNWFTFIRYDVLIRALKAAGLHTKWVMNVTDVGHLVSDADEGEDKLEKGARREGKTAWDIAKFYGDYFEKAIDRLNMLHPDHLPKATDHIAEQIALIQKLEEKGFTYTIDDGVYFDTSKLQDYGKLARLDIEHLKAGARVEANPQKHNATDFALWKFSPKDQKRDMEWDSPWGKGFPGWHLECSAMAIKYLGETIDIHGGGIDHIPVHHTNEIAQSEAATGKPFAHYWFHSNFILVDDKKMSKSAGTFVTLEEIEEKGFDLAAFRLLVLESHYRTEAHFSWEALEAAQNRLNDLRAWADLRHQPSTEEVSSELDNMWRDTLDGIRKEILNDLNTPRALAKLSQLVNWMSEHPIPAHDGKNSDGALTFIDSLLGLDLDGRPDITPEQKTIMADRLAARNAKDWQKSDKLRDRLKEQGIEVRDTSNGQIWSRT
jgi:cysteinyl-tRNA synthetase